MATIEARKSRSGISYRAKVRVKGHPLISESFRLKSKAKRWAVTRKQGWVQLSRAEEPVDTHWTVTVLGSD